MTHTYSIQGMTCQSCKAKVTDYLEGINGVISAKVDLENSSAIISMEQHIKTSSFQSALSNKYTISDTDVNMPTSGFEDMVERSKLEQLKPLFIILFYILTASILLHMEDWDIREMMIDFMGLFFIVFSFFKMLDIKGFAISFSMYDPVAKSLPFYGQIYPFIETVLGFMLLMRFNISIALIATIAILGLTSYGVTQALLAKRSIKCACLGTALNLPMTEATFIENAIMVIMSIIMLYTML